MSDEWGEGGLYPKEGFVLLTEQGSFVAEFSYLADNPKAQEWTLDTAGHQGFVDTTPVKSTLSPIKQTGFWDEVCE